MIRSFQMMMMALCLLVSWQSNAVASANLSALINALGEGGLSQVEAKINALVASGDPRIIPVLQALAAGELYVKKSDGIVYLGQKAGTVFALTDPVTGQSAGELPKSAIEKIKVNNNLRRVIRAALGQLTLLNPDRTIRLKAAQTILKNPDSDALGMIESALAKESDGQIRAVLEQAKAGAILSSSRPIGEKREALHRLRDSGDRSALQTLSSMAASADPLLKTEIEAVVATMKANEALWSQGQNVWYGISLGSVLLLAAIGLAITFGVMGVINMAHGEMVMLGAYTTFIVQDIIRTTYPSLFDLSLLIALPVAFLATALAGLLIERTVIRFLYGRPLETLLATWGLSLILQQGVRSLFGPTNQQVGNPSWMSGAFELGGLTITWNRLWIVVFALSVFLALLILLTKTSVGLKMRAVRAVLGKILILVLIILFIQKRPRGLFALKGRMAQA